MKNIVLSSSEWLRRHGANTSGNMRSIVRLIKAWAWMRTANGRRREIKKGSCVGIDVVGDLRGAGH
jgi:hypothetical protein